jgi:signal transduction histidine kinase
VVREVATFVEPSATTRGLRLVSSLPAEPVPMRTDPDKLRQVLLNLAGNAVKYTPAGEVRLRLLADGDDGAVIQVQDTGVGIGADDLAKIYEPFWQVDATQRSKDGGTGPGLSIVRRMMDLIGGRVDVASTLGEGTTFTVHLSDVAK